MHYCIRTLFVLLWPVLILKDPSVQPRTYTLKEAVTILHRSGGAEEANRITRHIRHWTSLDLLIPEGDKHTGTGRAREYRVEEIYRAAALLELAKWRVPVTVLADTFRKFTVDFDKEWMLAVDGKKDIYVTMNWSEGLTAWNIAVGKPELFMLKDPAAESGLGGPASAIVINLTSVLRGLRF
jgi:hypothetical protein